MTGGARGIGRAVVRRLVAEGAAVAFTWRRDPAAARALEDELGGAASGFPLDLADPERPSSLVREVEAAMGPLRGLVNSAGALEEALLPMTSDAQWAAVVEVNLGGAFRLCRAVVPGMVARRAGAIVNVASLSALHGLPGQAA